MGAGDVGEAEILRCEVTKRTHEQQKDSSDIPSLVDILSRVCALIPLPHTISLIPPVRHTSGHQASAAMSEADFVPYMPPVSPALHGTLATVLSMVGFSLMAYFFAARSSTKSPSLLQEVGIASLSSLFMGFGMRAFTFYTHKSGTSHTPPHTGVLFGFLFIGLWV